MSSILVFCRTCEQQFSPSNEAIKRGTWRICPACLQAQADQDASVIARRFEVAAQAAPGPEAA